jgi:hypothetical protein
VQNDVAGIVRRRAAPRQLATPMPMIGTTSTAGWLAWRVAWTCVERLALETPMMVPIALDDLHHVEQSRRLRQAESTDCGAQQFQWSPSRHQWGLPPSRLTSQL